MQHLLFSELASAVFLLLLGATRYRYFVLASALFLGYLGTVLALQSWTLAAWLPVFVASYVLFAREEEKMMERCFAEAYRAYLRQTGMFLPKWTRMRAATATNN